MFRAATRGKNRNKSKMAWVLFQTTELLVEDEGTEEP